MAFSTIVDDCKKKLPILERVKDKEIITDKTKPMNLMVEGDNYHALTCLNYTHRGKIDVIYIDPPYNTGKAKEWKFNDKYVDKEDKFRHSKWLNMMEKRLLLAHNLLTDNGVIFISIDDNEQANLKLLCDEIFKEINFVTCITRVTKSGGNKGDLYKPKKDYVLFYAKNVEAINKTTYGKLINMPHKWDAEIFNGKERKFLKGDTPYREKLEVRPNQRYYIQAPDGSLMIPKGNVFPTKKSDAEQIKPQSEEDNCWTWSRERYLSEKNNGRLLFIKSKKSPFLNENKKKSEWSVFKKIFEEDIKNKREILSDFISNCENSQGTIELDELALRSFTYPKSTKLIKWLIERTCFNNSIILDFFAGSGTTGHAVMKLNKEDGGNRKFILCTNNENNNGNGHGGIAEAVCYPRIQKAIQGYKKNGDGEWVAGLGGNLHYFKADENSFISIEMLKNISDEKRLELTLKAGELIVIRENIFDEKEHSKYYQIFEDDSKQVAIYFKEEHTKLNELVEKLDNTKEKIVYLFSWGKNLLTGDDLGYPDITVKDIPEPIIRIYQEING